MPLLETIITGATFLALLIVMVFAPPSAPIIASILSFILLLGVVLAPLFPAWVIYKYFPKDKISVSGPLKGFTLNITGATAAYFLILAGVLYLPNSPLPLTCEMIRTISRPTWNLKTKIKLLDKDNNDVTSSSIASLGISVIPSLTKVSNELVNTQIPDLYGGNYLINFNVPGFGQTNFRIDSKDILAISKIDNSRLTVEIPEVVIVQQNISPRPYNSSLQVIEPQI